MIHFNIETRKIKKYILDRIYRIFWIFVFTLSGRKSETANLCLRREKNIYPQYQAMYF